MLAGNYCQDVQLQQGARYRLTYFYGRLMTLTEGCVSAAVDVLLVSGCTMPARPILFSGCTSGCESADQTIAPCANCNMLPAPLDRGAVTCDHRP